MLWVTSAFPDPEASGEAAREYSLLSAVARDNQITLVTIDRDARVAALEAVRALGIRVRVVPWRARRHPRLRISKLAALAMGAAPSLEAWIRSSSLQPLGDAVEEEARAADVLNVVGGELAPVVARVEVPSMLVVPRVFSFEGEGDPQTSAATSVKASWERRNARAWERIHYARAGRILTRSEISARFLSELIERVVATIDMSAAGAETLESAWHSLSSAPDSVGTPEMSPRLPSASVVVCTRERPDMLKLCLTSINAAVETAPATKVIVIEQGTPSAQPVAAEIGLPVAIVSDQGRGASRARNLGLQAAQSDVVLFTDDDCEVPPGWIADHQAALADPSVVASLGRVSGLSRDDDTQDPAALPARHRLGSPPWLIGHASNLAARTDALRSIGGFDERIGPGSGGSPAGEDADVIVRLLRKGVVVSGTGEAVRHAEWRSASENKANLVAYEEGAGVWIGKALREDFRRTWPMLRERLDMVRARAKGDSRNGRALYRAYFKGLVNGLRLRAWRSR